MNIDEEAKSAVLRKQEDHLFHATAERSFYRKNCEESKKVANELKLERLKKSQPNSKDVAFHYSFDYAQQVHYPANRSSLRHQGNVKCSGFMQKVSQSESII